MRFSALFSESRFAESQFADSQASVRTAREEISELATSHRPGQADDVDPDPGLDADLDGDDLAERVRRTGEWQLEDW